MRPSWPYRLPGARGRDGVVQSRDGVVARLLHVEEIPIVVNAWRLRDGRVILRASPVGDNADEKQLETAIDRMRFALGLDDDFSDFYDRFRGDTLLGPAIRRNPTARPRRRPWPWEALAWAVTEQLIDVPRAQAIQRRIVRRWGPTAPSNLPAPGRNDQDLLRDVPSAATIAGVAPAELASMDLAPKRAIALIKVAREVAAGRADLFDPGCEPRLTGISEIGTWTVRCLGLFGRGDPDALPSGDLGYLKLIGHLAELGRRAVPEEVEEFFAPYEPYRGLAGTFVLREYHGMVAKGPPLRRVA